MQVVMPTDNIAVPILDAKDVAWAPEKIKDLYQRRKARIHLINVQPIYPQHIAQFFPRGALERIHLEDGMRVLQPVIAELDRAKVPHWDHVLIGLVAERVVEFVKANYCREVLLREDGEGRLVFGSVTSQIRKALSDLNDAIPGS